MRHLCIWGIVLLLARAAHAQVATDEFGIERMRLGIDRAALLDVDWAGVPEHGSWSATAYVGFAHDPLVVYRNDVAIDALVERRIATGLVGSYALWKRVQLGLGVDLITNQAGSESLMQLPSGGLGDARAIVKVLAYGTERFQLAVVPTLTIPGGSARGYLRESGVTVAPAIAISGNGDRLRLAGNIGYRMRARTETAGLVVDDEVFVRAGVGVAFPDIAEIAMSFSVAAPPTDRDGNQIAVEAMLGTTFPVTPMVDVFAAAGLGFANGFGTPDWRALAGVRIVRPEKSKYVLDAPKPPVVEVKTDVDADADGLGAKDDRCPGAAEDKDGFQDADGCPDPDGKVEGRVLDLEGLPIANAAIRVTYVDHPALAVAVVTDSDGRFVAPIAGSAALEIAAEIAEYQRGTVKVEPGGTGVEIKLARKVRQGQLRGQVLSFGGKPLAATVIVNAAGAEVARATANAEGNFTIELPAGSFEVVIEAAGHIPQKRTVKLKLDGVTVLNLDMRGTK